MNRILCFLKALYLRFHLRNKHINARGLYLQNYIKEQLMDETRERNSEYEEIINAVARSQGIDRDEAMGVLLYIFSLVKKEEYLKDI